MKNDAKIRLPKASGCESKSKIKQIQLMMLRFPDGSKEKDFWFDQLLRACLEAGSKRDVEAVATSRKAG